MWYDKKKINSAFNQYCDTEDPNDFGELLEALEPMIHKIARKWFNLDRHKEDVIQEIFLTLWRHQSDINKMKLLKMRLNNNGNRNGYCVSNYFYFTIRGYMGKVGPRFDNIYGDMSSYMIWYMTEKWISHFADVEGYGRYDDRTRRLNKAMENE